MESLSALDDLTRHLTKRLPAAKVTLDAPTDAAGTWWIDVAHEGRSATVEWRPKAGFGVSTEKGGYGEGPEVVFSTAIAAADHIASALSGESRKIRVLVASSDPAWCDKLFQELGAHRFVVETASGLTEITRRLNEHFFRVVVIDMRAAEYVRRLAKLLSGTGTVVILAGDTVDNIGNDWYEVFLRRAMNPAHIASVVESLITTESAHSTESA